MTLAENAGQSGIVSPVRVRNISPCGALIEGPQLPSGGTAVRLVRGALEAGGEVAWQSGDYRGLRFGSVVDVQAWVRRLGLALLRRCGQSGDSLPLADLERPTADTSRRISIDLDLLCEQLASSPEMSLELGEQLIRLDTIAQRLRKTASR